MTHLLYSFAAIGTAFLADSALTGSAWAENLTESFDTKHKACLEKIAVDADLAFEDAMIWKGDGGGRRARHCEAMALFALGHKEEAARRLDLLAAAPDGGTKDMRADFYAEAADFWLMANETNPAYASATAGLELNEGHMALRIARARAYALQGRYDYAEIDLTSALQFEPDHAGALRYRADARLQQGKTYEAQSDIERALTSDPESVETALLRGRIREAIRTAKAARIEAVPAETLSD